MSALTLQSVSRNLVKNTVNLRRESNVTIGDMAAATKLSESTIRRIEKFGRLGALAGNYRPQLSTVIKLANAAEVSPDDFITQELAIAE
jgi:transcriptional regulator with XRE-family HTH domain